MPLFLLRFVAARSSVNALNAAVRSVEPEVDERALTEELSRPKALPKGEGSSLRVEISAGVAVEWRENDPQEKVGTYQYAYVHARDVVLWGANFVGALMLEKEIIAWSTRGAWHEREALAVALSPHGFSDESAHTLLPWVMAHEQGERRDAFAAAFPGRVALVDGWIGAEYLSDDFHFPRQIRCAWRQDGGHVVEWVKHRYAPHPPALDAYLAH